MNLLYAIKWEGEELPDPDFVFKTHREAQESLDSQPEPKGRVVPLAPLEGVLGGNDSLRTGKKD